MTKTQIAFRDKEFAVVEEALLHAGGKLAEYDVPWFKSFLVPTTCGELRVNLDYSTNDGTKQASIYCRFAEPQRACAGLGLKPVFKYGKGRQIYDASKSRLNQYSGKWNFHCDDVTDLVTQFFLEINRILPAGVTLS